MVIVMIVVLVMVMAMVRARVSDRGSGRVSVRTGVGANPRFRFSDRPMGKVKSLRAMTGSGSGS